MALNPEIKDRIIKAADALFAASETGEFPNVEEVRKQSHAGMNNVVEVMQEWRQNQRKQVQAVREPLPASLLGVLQNMGQNLWETAQQLANESLDTARAAFESEKADLIQLSVEQSEAYESQAAALDAALIRVSELEQLVEVANASTQSATQQLAETKSALLSSEQKAILAEQKAEEIERRAGDLRAELDHAHAEADRLRIERDKAQDRAADAEKHAEKADARTEQLRETLTGQVEKADATIEQLRAELTELRAKADAAEQLHAEQRKRTAEEVHRSAERMTKAESECDNARRAAATAREEAAALRGQLEATKAQNAELLTALKPSKPPK